MNLTVEGQHSYLYPLLNYIFREQHKGCLCNIVGLKPDRKLPQILLLCIHLINCAEITQLVFCFS